MSLNEEKLKRAVGIIKKYLRIYKGSHIPSGFVLLLKKELPIKVLVKLVVIGKAYAYCLNLSETPAITPKECYEIIKKQIAPRNVNINTVRAYLYRISSEGFLTHTKEGYILNTDELDNFLSELEYISD